MGPSWENLWYEPQKSAFVENVTEKNHSQQTFIEEKVLTMKFGSKTCHFWSLRVYRPIFPNANSYIFIFQTHIRLVANSLQKERRYFTKKVIFEQRNFQLKIAAFLLWTFSKFSSTLKMKNQVSCLTLLPHFSMQREHKNVAVRSTIVINLRTILNSFVSIFWMSHSR